MRRGRWLRCIGRLACIDRSVLAQSLMCLCASVVCEGVGVVHESVLTHVSATNAETPSLPS